MKDMITDVESLLGESTLTGPDGRRGFLKVALGTGFAVAEMPVAVMPMPSMMARWFHGSPSGSGEPSTCCCRSGTSNERSPTSSGCPRRSSRPCC